MQRDSFITWVNTEAHKYVNTDSNLDSYNKGWEEGYMLAMRKVLSNYSSTLGPTDMQEASNGKALVTRYADGSVGIFIAPPLVSNLTERLNEMASMYADEERDNWWDADDIARSVAEDIHALLSD